MSYEPFVSVLLGSSRPGGVDMALWGLAHQTYPADKFEVIFVDARYHKRHARVLDYAEKVGLKAPLIHVPNHRNQPAPWTTACAGYNTGFMLARGELVVMFLDYAWAPPGWLAAHVKHHAKRRRFVMAPYLYVGMPKLADPLASAPASRLGPLDAVQALETIAAQRGRFDEISAFAEEFQPGLLADCKAEFENDSKLNYPPGPCMYSALHTKNDSFPLEDALEINGMDENYDRGLGPGDSDLGLRLFYNGAAGWLAKDEEIIAICTNPRGILPNPNAVCPKSTRMPPPHDWRMSYEEGNARYESVMRSARTWAPNPYSLREKRRELWAWREASQEREPVIPYNESTDADYFKESLPAPPASIADTRRLIVGNTRALIDAERRGDLGARHDYDPRTDTHREVWHKDANLQALVRYLIETVKPCAFVETGTHMGWTSAWVGENFPQLPIHTVEVDEKYFALACDNLKAFGRVHVTRGSSPDFLRGLLPAFDGAALIFWLDAHWATASPADRVSYPSDPVPLREECKLVAALPRYVCLIDDFYCRDPDFNGDDFGPGAKNDLAYVADILGPRCWRPNYTAARGNKGYGLFVKGIDLDLPPMVREDAL